MLEEYTPYGVIGAITPVTHSIPTIAGNIINMVAAGQRYCFQPAPRRRQERGQGRFRRSTPEIEKRLGIRNLICCVGNPTLESFDAICKSDLVSIMCITGGPGVVKAAMLSGKKSICAGPGNPPVIVDDTVDLNKAAADIIAGGCFDNNLLCIGEKEIFVLESVADAFMRALDAQGAVKIGGSALDQAHRRRVRKEGRPLRSQTRLGRQRPQVLAQAAGVSVSANAPCSTRRPTQTTRLLSKNR